MEIELIIYPCIEWYFKLDEEEQQFMEEIKQEISLDLKEQYGGERLW
jgi:hypothetical protein